MREVRKEEKRKDWQVPEGLHAMEEGWASVAFLACLE